MDKADDSGILLLAGLSIVGRILIHCGDNKKLGDQLCDGLQGNKSCDATCIHELTPTPTLVA
jgi:hypothetical protein